MVLILIKEVCSVKKFCFYVDHENRTFRMLQSSSSNYLKHSKNCRILKFCHIYKFCIFFQWVWAKFVPFLFLNVFSNSFIQCLNPLSMDLSDKVEIYIKRDFILVFPTFMFIATFFILIIPIVQSFFSSHPLIM